MNKAAKKLKIAHLEFTLQNLHEWQIETRKEIIETAVHFYTLIKRNKELEQAINDKISEIHYHEETK